MRVIKIDIDTKEVYVIEDFATELSVQDDLDLHIGTEQPVVGGMIKGHAFVVPNKKNIGQWAYAIEGVKGVFYESGIIAGADENFQLISTSIEPKDIHVAFVANGLKIITNK
jgi:hypothetical protein